MREREFICVREFIWEREWNYERQRKSMREGLIVSVREKVCVGE